MTDRSHLEPQRVVMSAASIRGRLEAATPGPWYLGQALPAPGYFEDIEVYAWDGVPLPAEADEDCSLLDAWADIHTTGPVATVTNYFPTEDNWEPNADLIAHAPADLAALLDVVEAARRQRDTSVFGPYSAIQAYNLEADVENQQALWAALDALEKLP